MFFFSKLSNFYFDLRPPAGKTPGQDRRAKTRPQGKLECANPLGSPGGMVRLGIDWYINIRESHKISNGKILYFRGHQPKTSWGTPSPPPPPVSLGLIDFFVQSHHHDLPYSKRSWKLILKMINSTAGNSPSHLYLRHTLIFLEICIFLKKRLWLKLKTYTRYFFKIPPFCTAPG